MQMKEKPSQKGYDWSKFKGSSEEPSEERSQQHDKVHVCCTPCIPHVTTSFCTLPCRLSMRFTHDAHCNHQAATMFNDIWRTGNPSWAKDIMTDDVIIVSVCMQNCLWWSPSGPMHHHCAATLSAKLCSRRVSVLCCSTTRCWAMRPRAAASLRT